MKIICILLFFFLSSFSDNKPLKGAEIINIKFEEMSIPISIDQLSKLRTYKEDSTELLEWFKNNGLKKIFELSKFLEFNVFNEENFSKQLLRSWMGRKLISEFSNIIIIPNDKNGVILFNTIENLLEKKEKLSTIDILRAIPINQIKLDVDNLILIISSWKRELEEQQKLITKLNDFDKAKEILILSSKKEENNTSSRKSINVSHRKNQLNLEIWKPVNNNIEKDVIIFMPGLGGDIGNFRWIGSELSSRGWPVIFIDHEGSNSDTLKAVIKGEEALPGGADNYLYRIKDLNEIINANKEGFFNLKNQSYILMGHSLGSLVAFLYEGYPPINGFEERCDKALEDFAVTNLSKLLQCQLSQIPLPEFNQSSNLKAIIGFNSFGSLIWPYPKKIGINIPVLLIGGTYDLITPILSEQFKLFLSAESKSNNRFLVVEGASHFSPIRVTTANSAIDSGEDVFKINENFIGSYPVDFQNLSLEIIVKFLNTLDTKNGMDIIKKQNAYDLKFHLLGTDEVREIIKN